MPDPGRAASNNIIRTVVILSLFFFVGLPTLMCGLPLVATTGLGLLGHAIGAEEAAP